MFSMDPSFAFRSDYGNNDDNNNGNVRHDNNNDNNNNADDDDADNVNNDEKTLFDILNSNNNTKLTADNYSNHSSLQPTQSLPSPQQRANITYEDVVFLKAANEVIKLHENRIDPTIKDILNRLQYSNSPHGGMPISMRYLESMNGRDNNIIDNEQQQQQQQQHQEQQHREQQHREQHHHHHHHNDQTNYDVNDHITNDLELNHGMNMVSTNEQSLSNYPANPPTPIALINHHQNPVSNDILSQSYIPPFTENPLRNPPTNLDFPHFSLDIFKNEEQMIALTSDNNNIDNNLASSTSKLMNLNESDDLARSFKCSECDISFKRSSDLKRHEKIHLKTPPNICSQCHKGFARRDALKRHIGTLTCNRNRMRLLKQLEENGETLQQ